MSKAIPRDAMVADFQIYPGGNSINQSAASTSLTQKNAGWPENKFHSLQSNIFHFVKKHHISLLFLTVKIS
jgi:hypothetical protein